MKEYHILKGKDQFGPFQVDELKAEGVTAETLVWCEGMENWQKAKDVAELAGHFKSKAVPPPPPVEVELPAKTEVSGHLTVTTQRGTTHQDRIKRHRKLLLILIVWCSIHLFAVLMSTSRVDNFNGRGRPDKSKFWPFVEFYTERTYMGFGEDRKEKEFDGIFVEYDWTEFALYTVGGVIAVVIFGLARGGKKETTNG